MSDKPTPLGALLRTRRTPLGWDRMEEETGLQQRAMRNYELGRMPPLYAGLRIGEALGLTLEELAELVLGRPYKQRETSANGAGSDHYDPVTAIEGSAAAASARAEIRAGAGKRPRRQPKR